MYLFPAKLSNLAISDLNLHKKALHEKITNGRTQQAVGRGVSGG